MGKSIMRNSFTSHIVWQKEISHEHVTSSLPNQMWFDFHSVEDYPFNTWKVPYLLHYNGVGYSVE